MDYDSDNVKLRAALRYQSVGMSIIPTGADKRPLIQWGPYQKIHATVEEIKAWWKQWPQANPALVTGKVSGIVALDLDAKYGRTAKEFSIPATASAKSGNGGEHFFFNYPNKPVLSKSAISGQGVDMRGDGGYILLAPSVNSGGGQYEWLVEPEMGIAEMPQWLQTLACDDGKKWQFGASGVLEGSRNDSAASMSGLLVKSISRDKWESACWPLIRAWNAQNKPPLPDTELRTTFESVIGLESKNSVKDVVSLGKAVRLQELLDTQFSAAMWTVEPFFETGTINMISAPPNQYKSWLVLMIAISVAVGSKFLDRFNTNKQAVLIINEEDTARMIQERLQILLNGEKNLPISFFIGKEIKIEQKFVDELIDRARSEKIGLIIFDSLRSVHNADENSSKEMQDVMNQLKRITAAGITVLFTHHNRKKSRIGNNKDDLGEESRGSSGINAALHGHLSCESCERDGKKYLVINQRKLKAAEKIKPFELVIDSSDKKLKFLYGGEHDSKEVLNARTKAKIQEILDKSVQWLNLKDLLAQEIGGRTTLVNCLKQLEHDGLIQAVTRKDAVKKSLPISSTDGKHNEKFYFRAADEQDNLVDNFEDF
ncbi:MAG: bifunctional DNA primase/polymerase [Candidatus Paceibacterota bacterium]